LKTRRLKILSSHQVPPNHYTRFSQRQFASAHRRLPVQPLEPQFHPIHRIPRKSSPSYQQNDLQRSLIGWIVFGRFDRDPIAHGSEGLFLATEGRDNSGTEKGREKVEMPKGLGGRLGLHRCINEVTNLNGRIDGPRFWGKVNLGVFRRYGESVEQ